MVWKFPMLGAKKLHAIFLKGADFAVPCVKTINNVLKRNGLIAPEASEAATPYVRFAKDAPNDMWQADFKGWFTINDAREGSSYYFRTATTLEGAQGFYRAAVTDVAD